MSKDDETSSKAVTVGRSIPRSDALEKVTGKALYPGDLQMDGQVYMKVLFARRPSARILNIDKSPALALPGVLAVLTAQDVPVNLYGIEIADQPVLCSDFVRFVGDRIALVIAETEELAAQAANMIRVEFEDLPILDSPQAALAPGTPVIHPDRPDNILVTFDLDFGDVKTGFEEADFILEETYQTGSQEHVYLQPDAGLAWVDEDNCIIVKSAGQWVHDDQRQIAHCLDLPEDQVRIIYAHIGGAFGGREDLNIQICLALAALKVRKPVKAVLTREETTIGHPKRHPMQIHHKWGVSHEGKLIAQQIEILADVGAYASTSISVISTTVMTCTGPYEAPNVRINAQGVYTNNPISGAFRGFGAPQAVFAAESQISRLAAKLHLDPVEFRMLNLAKDGSYLASVGMIPPRVSARETLEATALAAGWEKIDGVWSYAQANETGNKNRQQGTGIAIGWKPIGYSLGWKEEATVQIELQGEEEIETAWVTALAAEIGQGSHTVIQQIASQALSVPIERIFIRQADSAFGPSVGPSSASRMTLMVGNALIGAAKAALSAWKNEERPASATFTYKAPETYNFSDLNQNYSATIAIGFMAQAVEIEVDLETGQIEVQRIISSHNVGRAINPQAVEGQIHGGAVQGMGWATMEKFIVQSGEILTTQMSTYLIPTAADVPANFEMIILEKPNPAGPWGAIGIGELPLLGVAPAINHALHQASGVWCNSVPLAPENVWKSF